MITKVQQIEYTSHVYSLYFYVRLGQGLVLVFQSREYQPKNVCFDVSVLTSEHKRNAAKSCILKQLANYKLPAYISTEWHFSLSLLWKTNKQATFCIMLLAVLLNTCIHDVSSFFFLSDTAFWYHATPVLQGISKKKGNLN